MTENGSSPLFEQEQDIDVADLLQNYLLHWKMFAISFILCIAATITYLIFTSPEYGTSAKILVKEDDKSTSLDLMSAFTNLSSSIESKNMDNETEILKSRSLMMIVSDSLNLRVNYFSKNNIRKFDLYHKAPIILKYNGFKTYDDVEFTIDYDEKDDLLSVKNKELKIDEKVKWGQTIATSYGTFAIYKNTAGKKDYPLDVLIQAIQRIPLIGIDPSSKYSSVLELSLKESNPDKAIDIINTLVYFYNRDNKQDKNTVAQNTIDFINNRLVVVSSELDSVERGMEAYKKANNLTNFKTDANIDLKANSKYEEKISDADIQVGLLGSIRSYLENEKNKDKIVPSNLGVIDPTLISLINGFNGAQLEKARMTQGMKPGNPVLTNYENQTAEMRKSLIENIKNVEAGAKLTRSELKNQGSHISDKISGLATQEYYYRALARQQLIKEKLYVYLLQKREENELLLRAVSPGAKIIDATFVDPKPVSPRKSILLIVAFVFSILIPAGILYIKDLISFKVESKDELEKLTKIPFLGNIPIRKQNSFLKAGESGSILSEQFRLNATNIDFMLPQKTCKRIMITSTVSGEGKTFYATNLAISLANVGKKVLYINLDIHKADIVALLNITSKKGVTNYLSDAEEQLSDIIVQPKGYDSLYILPAGHIPPNPGLLLMSSRLPELFAHIEEQFEYIIIDTPPIGLIADAMTINRYADATIYIVRAQYTPKSAIKNLNTLAKSNQLKNVSIVLNGGDTKGNYGKYYNKYYKK